MTVAGPAQLNFLVNHFHSNVLIDRNVGMSLRSIDKISV